MLLESPSLGSPSLSFSAAHRPSFLSVIFCKTDQTRHCTPLGDGASKSCYVVFYLLTLQIAYSKHSIHEPQMSQGGLAKNMESVKTFFFIHLTSEDSESLLGEPGAPPRAAEKHTPDCSGAWKMQCRLSDSVLISKQSLRLICLSVIRSLIHIYPVYLSSTSQFKMVCICPLLKDIPKHWGDISQRQQICLKTGLQPFLYFPVKPFRAPGFQRQC